MRWSLTLEAVGLMLGDHDLHLQGMVFLWSLVFFLVGLSLGENV